MITFPRRTRTNRYPDVVLRCDGVACNERHEYPYGTTCTAISHAIKQIGWQITFRNGRFEHRCSACARLTKVSQSYIDRIVA